jgi:hypothetical protein
LVAANAARSTPVLFTNIETGEAVEYVSLREAAREAGVNKNTVNNYIKTGKPFKGI